MRSPLLVLAFGMLALPAVPASASSLTLDLSGNRTALGRQIDGTLLYRAPYGRHLDLTGTVLDDHGAPAAAGTVVHLTLRTHQGDPERPLADVHADASGRFVYHLAPDHGRLYSAHVDAGAGVAAADANDVRLYVAPSIRLTNRLAQTGTRYRISGRLRVPSPRAAGRIHLLRCNAHFTHCHLVASLRTHADGAWKTSVVHRTRGRHSYLIDFAPADPLVWAASRLRLAVDFS